jgi:hypothetical protein
MRLSSVALCALFATGCLDKALSDLVNETEEDVEEAAEGGDGGGDGGGGSEAPTQYEGLTERAIGGGEEVGALDVWCAWSFNDSGTPAEPCPECDWAFDVNFSYDSVNDYVGGCGDLSDFSIRLGYDSGYDGGPVMWGYAEEYGEWYPAFVAEMSGEELAFGYYAYEVSDYYDSYYYGYTWYSIATVR